MQQALRVLMTGSKCMFSVCASFRTSSIYLHDLCIFLSQRSRKTWGLYELCWYLCRALSGSAYCKVHHFCKRNRINRENVTNGGNRIYPGNFWLYWYHVSYLWCHLVMTCESPPAEERHQHEQWNHLLLKGARCACACSKTNYCGQQEHVTSCRSSSCGLHSTCRIGSVSCKCIVATIAELHDNVRLVPAHVS